MRILQGTYEIANQMTTMSDAINDHTEYSCETILYEWYKDIHGYKADRYFPLKTILDEYGRDAVESRVRALASELIPDFDIFHFHFNTTLTLNHSDLSVIQTLGKIPLMHLWGSDIRTLDKALEINPYAKVKNVPWLKDNPKRSEFLSKYISHCIVGDAELEYYAKEYYEHVYVLPTMINLAGYPVSEKTENEKFLIVHAPTSPEIKGTETVLKVVKDLHSAGYEFDFKLIQQMNHEEAKDWYRKADLIIDELHCGTYGLLAVECMAMGKPVITWISPWMRERYPGSLPLISANPDNLWSVVDDILRDFSQTERLNSLGIKGREYVETYHDAKKNVNQLTDIYEEVARSVFLEKMEAQ